MQGLVRVLSRGPAAAGPHARERQRGRRDPGRDAADDPGRRACVPRGTVVPHPAARAPRRAVRARDVDRGILVRHPRNPIGGRTMRITGIATALALCAGVLAAQAAAPARQTPADGFTIHVSAPPMISGHEMGPVHHFCKVIAPDPIIQCLLYDDASANAPLTGVEYIIAKKITRPLVTLGTWNANFHDHQVEIAT